MDWSSIYDESGEEEGYWEGWISRLDPILNRLALNGKYGPTVCYALTVNYILGVGCLGIPFAFLKSGVVLGVIVVIFLTSVTLVTVLWVAEVGYRSIQIRIHRTKGRGKIPFTSPRIRHLINDDVKYGSLSTTIPSDNNRSPKGKGFPKLSAVSDDFNIQKVTSDDMFTKSKKRDDTEIHRPSPKHKPKHRIITDMRVQSSDESDSESLSPKHQHHVHEETEVISLVHEFLGSKCHMAYQLSLMMLTYTGSLAYAQVFNNTFLLQLYPTCPIIIPTLIFGIIVVPLTCMELSEQISIQVVMSVLRFLSLGILFFGSLVALLVDQADSSITNINNSNLKPPYIASNVPYVDLTGFSIIFTTTIFSQLFQHSVPGIIRPLSLQYKMKVPLIFGGALLTTGSIYILTGVVSVLFFGYSTNQSINLNFIDFTWGVTSPFAAQLLKLLSMIVVLFPALDTLSVFPLIANTLGNNMNAFFPSVYKHFKRASWVTALNTTPRHAATIFWRLLASIPPVLISVFVTDLSVSLEVAGICGIIVALVTPALLQRYSILKIQNCSGDLAQQKTPYTTIFSELIFTSLVLLIAVIGLVICIQQLFSRLLV